MQKRIVQAGNTVVPAILAVESLGFDVEVSDDKIYARRGQEEFGAEDSVALLGLYDSLNFVPGIGRRATFRSTKHCGSVALVDRRPPGKLIG
jgi:hypothetical protein